MVRRQPLGPGGLHGRARDADGGDLHQQRLRRLRRRNRHWQHSHTHEYVPHGDANAHSNANRNQHTHADGNASEPIEFDLRQQIGSTVWSNERPIDIAQARQIYLPLLRR